MPAAIPIISAIVAAAGVGTSIYEGVASRDAQSDATKSNAAALKAQQQAAANQANLTKQEAVLGAQGQAQQQTGGSLTDSGTAALTDLLAGYPGYQGGGSSAGGTGSGTTSTGIGVGSSGVGDTSASGVGTGAGTPDIAALLAALRGGAGGGLGLGLGSSPSSTLSGGNWQSQPAQPQGHFELSNPVL
jgi:hypothetical protein